ncbi:MAG: hypothetical protein ACM3ZQ_11370 [Bacillota bacterium]
MKEFPGRYPKPKNVVAPELVSQALAERDYETAVRGIITAIWHAGRLGARARPGRYEMA